MYPTTVVAYTGARGEHVVGLPLSWSFADHDGFDGVIFGLPDERAQLELVRSPHGDVPAPTGEDALVLYHVAEGGGPEGSRTTRRPASASEGWSGTSSPERGYPEGIQENGIPLRDMVWMDQDLDDERTRHGADRQPT